MFYNVNIITDIMEIAMKTARLLSIKIEGVKRFSNSTFAIDLMNYQRVQGTLDDGGMYKLHSSIYLPKIIGFAGINSSGKSTSLKLINWTLNVFLCNMKISESFNKGIEEIFENTLTVETCIASENKLFLVKSSIKRDALFDRPIFIEEEIFEREMSASVRRSNILSDNDYQLKYKRSTLDEDFRAFLEDDKSISKLIIGKNDDSVISYFDETFMKHGMLNIGEADNAILHFLDSSIEYILPYTNFVNISSSAEKLYKVKFMRNDEQILKSKDILNVLSDGTIKGIGLFKAIKLVFDQGGYLLIDEIENNFNKSIIIDIFKLFLSPKSNPKGAMLLCTTHYTEIIDVLERNDMVFFNAKTEDGKLSLVNLSVILKRSDIKKSEIYFSDNLNIGTAIDYEKYLEFKRYFSDRSERNTNASKAGVV